MAERYEVLSPWAEADPVPVRGIRQRLPGLEHKHIGLFINAKRAAPLIQEYVERELKERIPSVRVSRFIYPCPLDGRIDAWTGLGDAKGGATCPLGTSRGPISQSDTPVRDLTKGTELPQPGVRN